MTYGSGKEIKTLNSGWVLGLQWEGSWFVMGLGAVDLWVGVRYRSTKFGIGPWTAMRRKLFVMGLGAVDLWVGEKF